MPAAPSLKHCSCALGRKLVLRMPNPVRTAKSETKGYQLRHDNDSARRKTNQLLRHATKQQP